MLPKEVTDAPMFSQSLFSAHLESALRDDTRLADKGKPMIQYLRNTLDNTHHQIYCMHQTITNLTHNNTNLTSQFTPNQYKIRYLKSNIDVKNAIILAITATLAILGCPDAEICDILSGPSHHRQVQKNRLITHYGEPELSFSFFGHCTNGY
jgi:hypothetical protein